MTTYNYETMALLDAIRDQVKSTKPTDEFLAQVVKILDETDFERQRKHGNWMQYVPRPVQTSWNGLSTDAKMAVYLTAFEAMCKDQGL